MREVVFDIETTDFGAVGGGMLVVVVFQSEGKQEVLRMDQFHDPLGHEVQLVSAVIHKLMSYELVVGHNIANFDLPWLRSRAIHLGIEGLPMLAPLYYDTLTAFKRLKLKTVPNRIGKPSAGLGHVIDFHRQPQVKTAIYPAEHWEAVLGKNKAARTAALDTQEDHCRRDVQGTAAVYPLLLQHDLKAIIKRWY